MKAFVLKKYGKIEKLDLTEVLKPAIKEHEVLVQIHASWVNVLDSMIKRGEFKAFLPYKTPLVLWYDMAGIVVSVGSKIKKFKVGDEVYSRVGDYRIGTFAEYITVDESDLAIKPKNLSMEEAASIPLVWLTALQALVEVANIKKGQKVFIQAGSGGVGTFAIQLAKSLWAFVATTTSSKNMELVKNLWADLVIDYTTQDFETMIEDYDLVLHSNKDTKILEKSLRVLSPGGQLISLVGPPTPEFAWALHLPWYLKFIISLLSLNVRKRARQLNRKFTFLFMRADGNQLGKITELIESWAIRPIVDRVFPFEQTNEALEYVETGRVKWKVVIKSI